MLFSTCFKGLIFLVLLTPKTGEGQTPKTAKRQEERLVVKENSNNGSYNSNYKQSHNKGKKEGRLTVNTETDSLFEGDNYKNRPHTQAYDVITIKKEPVEKKDENYKHQFPSGK